MWIRSTAKLISHSPLNNVGLRLQPTQEINVTAPVCVLPLYSLVSPVQL